MIIKTAANYHLESNGKNRSEVDECNNGTETLLKPKSAPTSQIKVKSKRQIIITKQQRYWAANLFKQYGLPIPGWLRTTFIINQRRRKLLNDILWEANLGSDFCGHCQSSDDFSYHLHCLYHCVNGGLPCL